MHTVDIAIAVFAAGVIVVSLLSNVLVLICFLHNSEIRKQVPGLFILNLTLGNLFLTVFNMPLTLAGLIMGEWHPGGGVFCQIVGFLDTFLHANSMLSMAALSIDRWVAVVFPLCYHSRIRHLYAGIAVGYTWVHSLALSAVAARLSWFGHHRVYASCVTLCNARGNHAQFMIYTVLLHSLTFFLTLIVLCVTYLKVLQVARRHCKRIEVITMQTLVLLVDVHSSVRQNCLTKQRHRKQRALKKISTFIGTFVVCFAPYVITRLVELVSPEPISPHWGVACKCLAYSKAACDPFVYSLLRQQFRKSCSDLTYKVLRRRPRPALRGGTGRRPRPALRGGTGRRPRPALRGGTGTTSTEGN